MKQHGPWKIKSSEVKYKNPWIEVREDKVIQPDGADGIFSTIKFKNGVSVLALDDEGYVYLTEEFHYGYGAVTIEAVGEGSEGNEDPLTTAKRGLKEETGITAKEWIDLGIASSLTTYMHHEQRLFLACSLTFGSDRQDVTETIKVRKTKFAEAIQMVMDSKIISSHCCILILKAAKYLGKI